MCVCLQDDETSSESPTLDGGPVAYNGTRSQHDSKLTTNGNVSDSSSSENGHVAVVVSGCAALCRHLVCL